MATGAVAGGLILGMVLWVPVSHLNSSGHANPNANKSTHSSAGQHNQSNGAGQVRHGPPTVTYYLRPKDLAALTRNSDAVFEAKINGAHARMYRGSPQPYRLYQFRLLAVIKGNVNSDRQIWQSTRGDSSQTRLEVGHSYLLATRNTPGNPYLVLSGPRAVVQLS